MRTNLKRKETSYILRKGIKFFKKRGDELEKYMESKELFYERCTNLYYSRDSGYDLEYFIEHLDNQNEKWQIFVDSQ